jgi:hypothetical protein
LELKGVVFLPSVVAHGVAEYDGSDGMRARRSRSQQALCWERGRPRLQRELHKKTYPFKEGWGEGDSNTHFQSWTAR